MKNPKNEEFFKKVLMIIAIALAAILLVSIINYTYVNDQANTMAIKELRTKNNQLEMKIDTLEFLLLQECNLTYTAIKNNAVRNCWQEPAETMHSCIDNITNAINESQKQCEEKFK